MSKSFFVTATDTSAGKTMVSCGLLIRAKNSGMTTLGIKPIASGCKATKNGLRNSDAMALHQLSSLQIDYHEVNPIALKPAIAPHIALQQLKKSCTIADLSKHCQYMLAKKAGLTIIEGAGGWRVPLNFNEAISELVIQLKIPIILVVAVKLGCINHAILTYEAIKADNLLISGWVANSVEPDMLNYKENVNSLKHVIPAPCIGEIPYIKDCCYKKASGYISIPN